MSEYEFKPKMTIKLVDYNKENKSLTYSVTLNVLVKDEDLLNEVFDLTMSDQVFLQSKKIVQKIYKC